MGGGSTDGGAMAAGHPLEGERECGIIWRRSIMSRWPGGDGFSLVDGQRWRNAVPRSTAEGGELEPQLHRLFLASHGVPHAAGQWLMMTHRCDHPEGSIASLEERSMLVDGQRWLSAVPRSTAEGGELEPSFTVCFWLHLPPVSGSR